MTSRIRWTKACACEASASASSLVRTETPGCDGVIRVEMTWQPGPVCDECKTPWKITRRGIVPDAAPREFEHADAVGHLFKVGTRVIGTVNPDGSSREGKATVKRVLADLGDHAHVRIAFDENPGLMVERFVYAGNLLRDETHG